MVVLSSLWAVATLSTTAVAAPGQAGAVGVGISERFGWHSTSRTHLMTWLRPTDPLNFGVGLGHASTRDAQTGVSLRLTATVDLPLTQLGPFELLAEGGGVSTLGFADSRPVATIGPAARLVLLSSEEPLSVVLGWAPELQPGSAPAFEAAGIEVELRVWF